MKKHQIGVAWVSGPGQVTFKIRAEEPDGSVIGHSEGTTDLAKFLAEGWDLDGKLKKEGDTARVMAEGDPVQTDREPDMIDGKRLDEMTMAEKLAALQRGNEQIKKMRRKGIR